MISRHQTLEPIKIIIRDNILDVDIFDKMIDLWRARPNAEFNSGIEVDAKNRVILEHYKNKYQQTKDKMLTWFLIAISYKPWKTRKKCKLFNCNSIWLILKCNQK